MDEQTKDLLDMAMSERLEIAFADMKKSEPQTVLLIKQEIELSETIESGIEIGQETKDLIERYRAVQTDLDDRYQKHLYLQGAKDCVAVRWHLENATENIGVIK